MTTYIKLSKDTVWGVRRDAVAILPEISQICSPELRNTQLVDLYKLFSKDGSKWVKNASFEYFGPFIVTLKGLPIDPSLIKHFIAMGDPKHGGSANENTFHCAYNFPAVLYTLGQGSW